MYASGSNQTIEKLKVIYVNNKLAAKIKSTGIYLLIPVINFAVSFFTSPIFAKYLSAEEFGYLGYYNTLASFLLVFSSLSLQTYFMSVYFKESEEKRLEIQTTLIAFTLLWNLLFFPISYIGIFLYLKLSHSQIPFYPFALLAMLTSVLGIFRGFVQVNYRLGRKPVKFLLIVSGYRVLTVVISLALVVYPKMHLQGRMLGILLVEIVFFIISLFSLLKGQKIAINRDIVKLAFRKVLPLLPASFLFWPMMSYDNIILERMHQPKEMGLYNIGKGIANYLFIALQSFFQTFEPDIYKYASTYNIKALKRTAIAIITLVVISIFVYWVLSPILIKYLTAGRFTGAIYYSNILAVTYGLIIIYSMLDAIILSWQQTHVNLVFNIIGAGLSLVSYTVAGIYFKQTGVATATVFTHLVLVSMLTFFVVRRIINHVPDQLSVNS
jgi:O-antigen/teichoic acid export membrane protein